MDVVIAGGHGQIALRLIPLLRERNDTVRAIIRNPAHVEDVKAAGAAPVLCDLEHASDEEVADAVRGADQLVFAAGAGPGSGAARKLTMDRDSAVRLMHAGPRRYVMVSSMGAADPPEGDDDFAVYLRAKGAADRALIASDLDWTIVRPGRLTNDHGTGLVRAGESVPRGDIPRDDVAAVLAVVLDEPALAGVTFELVGGETPVVEAVQALVPDRPV
jgi:uncharacterized protein YbjT (DUF2867 family)